MRDTPDGALGVLIVLWLALRSWKIIGAVFFSLMVGLATTAALGLAMVGSFNLISIAFFVLFVGLGVDFGIQFSVRYRTERHEHHDLREALRWAARKAGDPLALAAAATAVGFFSFLPTDYRGLSELGLIAGFGMLIAFLCSITLVPAMLALLNPPGEAAAVGFRASRHSTLSCSGIASRDRRYHPCRACRHAAVVASAVRLQPGQPAGPNSPSVLDLPRAAARSADRRQRCRGFGAVARTGRRDRQAPGRVARGFARSDRCAA